MVDTTQPMINPKEPFWQSRRFWGAVLTFIAGGLGAMQSHNYVVAGSAGIGGVLALISYLMPKDN